MESSYDPGVVVCPECGSEYQPHVAHCIDCGTPTLSGEDLDKELARRAMELLTQNQDFVLARSEDLHSLERLGSFLEEHGIPWRLEVPEENRFSPIRYHYYSIRVEEGDLDRARELQQEYLLIENPDLAAELIDLPSIDQCPACGSRVSPERSECPICGLALDGG